MVSSFPLIIVSVGGIVLKFETFAGGSTESYRLRVQNPSQASKHSKQAQSTGQSPSQASKHSKQAQLKRRLPIATARQPLGNVGNRAATTGGQGEGKVSNSPG